MLTLTLHRRQRLGLLLGLVVAVLFAQLLTSAHACPQGVVALEAMEYTASYATQLGDDSEPAATSRADRHDCDDMRDDPDVTDSASIPSQLCLQHCSPAGQTVPAYPATQDPPTPTALLAVLDWALATSGLSVPQLGLAHRYTYASAATPRPHAPRVLRH
ncbi:MAG: hypothetical protein RIQ60_4219 [Pseudomonadota bacterium]